MTVEDILNEKRAWPAQRVEELVLRLNQSLDTTDPEQIEPAWRDEVQRRLAEIDNGTVQLRDGEEVSARIRKIVGR